MRHNYGKIRLPNDVAGWRIYVLILLTGVGFIITMPAKGQNINTIAGNGIAGYSGDNIPATQGEFQDPLGIAVDTSYNIYIGDELNNRVREISGGIITTVAGTGVAGYSGDGGPATNAQINNPTGIIVDDSGNIYFADFANAYVRKITKATGIITSIAGTGVQGYSGDGIPATTSEINNPLGVAIDDSGNIYIADKSNCRIRKITKATGIITTIAGTGTYGISSDGIPATTAEITNPWGVAVDDSGNIYFSDTYSNRIREVNKKTGIITTIAGNGTGGYTGDGGPGTNAEIYLPTEVSIDSHGNVYFGDFGNDAVREVIISTGIINTIAGVGTPGFSGDGGPATDAELDDPWGVAIDLCSNVYITDESNERVRKVTVNAPPNIQVANDSVSMCSGGEITLTVSGAGTYTWSPATGLSATSGSSVTANVLTNTTYTILGTDNCGQTGTATIAVTIIPAPPLTILPPSPSVCSGQSITLSVPGAGSEFTWSPALSLSTTSGDSVIATPASTTVYSVAGTDSGGCSAIGTDTVKIISAPPLVILPQPPPTFCNGLSATLTVSGGGQNFIWSPLSGLSATTGDSVVAAPAVTTTYTVTGIDSVGCTSNGIEVVSVVPSPNKPTYYQHGDTLISSSKYDNQWYRNDTLLTSDTSEDLIITALGQYWVIVNNEANGCSTASDSMYITQITGVNQVTVESGQVTVYPNPVSNQLTISSNYLTIDEIDITNVLGQLVFVSSENPADKNRIAMSGFPNGMYFITVINKTTRTVVPIVKQN